VSRTINWGIDERLLSSSHSAVSAFRAFTQKKIFVWCVGASIFYTRILRLFNIPATTYRYAYDNPHHYISHAVTIVCDPTEEEDIFYLFGAYLNSHYEDTHTNGLLVDFASLLVYIQDQQYDSFRVAYSPVTRSYLRHRDQTTDNEFPLSLAEKKTLQITSEGHLVFQVASAKRFIGGWLAEVDEYRGDKSRDEFLSDIILCNAEWGSFGDPNIDYTFNKLMGSIHSG
jgi:hypothetical protein